MGTPFLDAARQGTLRWGLLCTSVLLTHVGCNGLTSSDRGTAGTDSNGGSRFLELVDAGGTGFGFFLGQSGTFEDDLDNSLGGRDRRPGLSRYSLGWVPHPPPHLSGGVRLLGLVRRGRSGQSILPGNDCIFCRNDPDVLVEMQKIDSKWSAQSLAAPQAARLSSRARRGKRWVQLAAQSPES